MSNVSIKKPPSSEFFFSFFLQMKKGNRAIEDIKQQEIIESVKSLDLNAKGGISSKQSYNTRLLTTTPHREREKKKVTKSTTKWNLI